jgi:hypothetical protein
MLQELVVREILCKPVVLTISRKEISETSPAQMAFSTAEPPKKETEEGMDKPLLQGGTEDSKQ